MQTDVILRRFDQPDEVRELVKGRFELVRLGGMTIGRATYEPGWRWSEHVGPALGQTHCNVEHVGLVLSGTATAAFADGRVFELRAGELFYIPPEPHDSWVVGDEPYTARPMTGPACSAGTRMRCSSLVRRTIPANTAGSRRRCTGSVATVIARSSIGASQTHMDGKPSRRTFAAAATRAT